VRCSTRWTRSTAVGPFCQDLRPADVGPAEAAAGIERLAHIERQVAGAKIRMIECLDESVIGDDREGARTRWLAPRTRQSTRDAGRDVAVAEALAALLATEAALRRGELSAAQAHEVTSAAVLDPSAEAELLHLARPGSLADTPVATGDPPTVHAA